MTVPGRRVMVHAPPPQESITTMKIQKRTWRRSVQPLWVVYRQVELPYLRSKGRTLPAIKLINLYIFSPGLILWCTLYDRSCRRSACWGPSPLPQSPRSIWATHSQWDSHLVGGEAASLTALSAWTAAWRGGNGMPNGGRTLCRRNGGGIYLRSLFCIFLCVLYCICQAVCDPSSIGPLPQPPLSPSLTHHFSTCSQPIPRAAGRAWRRIVLRVYDGRSGRTEIVCCVLAGPGCGVGIAKR